MHWLQIVRLSVLGFAIFCGIVVASLSAHLIAYVEENFGGYYAFAALGVATGGLTMLSLPVILIIDLLRKGAFTSLVVVELSWLGILWVLWLATAALTVDSTSAVFTTCDFIYPILNQLCHETQAIEAFSFLAWIALLAYTILLLIVALVNASRGAPMWKSTVAASGGIAPAPAATAGAGQHVQQQQQQQPLMTTPMTPPPAGQQPMQQYQPQPIYGGQPVGAYPQQQQPPAPTPLSGVSYTQNGSVSGYSSYPQV